LLFNLLVLGSTALVHLGAAPDPGSNEAKVELTQATHTIDLLEVLKGKTAGNLTAGEFRRLDDPLFDLRMDPTDGITLMEEAVKRGLAAFSQDEAKRRGVPWLDLVRDQRVKERMAALVEEWSRQGHVPSALLGLVTPDQARSRWAALKEFHAKNRHFLVTNGPYRLHQWVEDGVVLQAFRDPSYPLGIGAFDGYAVPRRAYVSKLEIRDGWMEVRAEVEKVFQFQRSYQLVREPFRGQAGGGDTAEPPLCRYVVVASDGSVAGAGRTSFGADGAARLDLKGALKPGVYTIAVALSLGGNEISPEVKTMRLTLEGF